MNAFPLVLLPGLDGTGALFEPLLRTAQNDAQPIVLSLPRLAAYEDILNAVRTQMPDEPFAVLGESFSGPLALAIAHEMPERVMAVILCNSFVVPPITPLLRFFPWSLLFLLPPPRWAIRWLFVGRAAPEPLVSDVRAAIAKAGRRLLAARMREVFRLPRRSRLRIKAPVLCLIGSRDAMVAPNRKAIEEIAPDVTFVSIPGPHLLLQVSPAEAWKEIVAFRSVRA